MINSTPRHRGLKVALLALLVAVVSAGIWAVYTDQFAGIHSGSEAQKVETGATEGDAQNGAASATVEPAAANAAGEKAADAQAPDAPQTNAAPANAAAAQPETPAAAPQAQHQAQSQSQPQANAAAPQTQAAQTAPAGVPIRVVRFEVTSPCWVQVIAPNGRNVIAREMQPGSPVTADIPQGSRITVGNAGALSLTIDGKPYDIRQEMRNGISRVTLE